MSVLVLALSLAMLLGGDLFLMPQVSWIYIVSLVLVLPFVAYKFVQGTRPPLLIPAGLLFVAGLISTIANPGFLAWTFLLVWIGGFCMMILAADLGEERVLKALWMACWVWMIFGPILHLLGINNRNYDAIFPALGLILAFAKGRPVWGLPFLAALLFLNSRGALLGAVVGVLIWYAPTWNPRRLLWAVLALPVGVAALFAIRPRNAMDRFYYIEQVIANAGDHLLLGVGPGGILPEKLIPDPHVSGKYFAHAHNLFANILAEMGLLGVLAMLLAAAWLWWAKPVGRWQLALIGMVLAHSLVDMPLYWPGCLLAVAAVAGVVGVKNKKSWSFGTVQ